MTINGPTTMRKTKTTWILQEKKTSAELHSADKTKLKSLKYHFLMEAQIQQLNGQLLRRTRLPHCC